MALISLRQLSIAFGGPSLLDNISLQVEKGDRICLLGRNGAGKSTLLKLIAGELPPDAGSIDRQQGLQIARLDQEMPRDLNDSVYTVIASGFGLSGELLCRYHSLNRALAAGDEGQMPEMIEIQQALDSAAAWPLEQKIEQVLSKLDLDADALVNTLSGGVKRRVFLAKALVTEPDILLLDEPTNHLDITSIDWLEAFLKREKLTLIFITHDRAFLRSLATRVVELDRGRLFDFAGNYDTFLRHKQELLHNEPVLMASLFVGLVAGSVIIAWRMIKVPAGAHVWIAIATGVVVFAALGLRSGTTEESVAQLSEPAIWAFFISGAIAICAMILPGISGSFILVMLGMYGAVLNSVTTRDLVSLGVFAVGAIVGLALFSRVLHRALTDHHDTVIAILVGLMAGSLRVLWPWPLGVDSTDLGVPDSDIGISVVMMVVGFAAMIVIAAIANRIDDGDAPAGR